MDVTASLLQCGQSPWTHEEFWAFEDRLRQAACRRNAGRSFIRWATCIAISTWIFFWLEPNGRFLLADCGAAVPISVGGRASGLCVGTPGYIAPEILHNKPYNELVDLFSLGAMMHVSICGHRLFPGNSCNDILKANVQCTIDLHLHASTHLNADGLEFLGNLLAKEPSKRRSARDALGFKWLKEGDCNMSTRGVSISDGLKDSRAGNDPGNNNSDDDEDLYQTSKSSCNRSADRNEYTKGPKGKKLPKRSYFLSLLRRPGVRQGKSFTKVFPHPANEDQLHLHGTALDHNTWVRSPPGARESRTNHASGLVAWLRGRNKQRSNASTDADIACQHSPVVCN